VTLRLVYYADDFTGATDALEQLENAGVRTRLFMEPPSRKTLVATPEIEAIGVAGRTRSLPTAEIDAEVRPALRVLRELGASHVHYKVCSTFDSSSEVGSIGRVIDIASEEFAGPFIPLVVGAPGLGRWCVFGNLFASYGIGADTPAYRLDRHPSMSRHPVTPADEADLRVHLAKQTSKRIALVDIRTIDRGPQLVLAAVERACRDDAAEIVLFDCLSSENVATIGAALEHYSDTKRPRFSVGSSVIETALASQWSLPTRVAGPSSPRGPVLVLAGSCSPVTATQIDEAKQAGFSIVRLDARRLITGDRSAVDKAATQAVEALASASGVIVSSQGSANRDIELPADRLGAALAEVYRRVRDSSPLGLTVIAGGDTSSYAARSLRIESLSYHSQLTPGAPICRATSTDPLVDGGCFVFKGGQVGRPDLFASLIQSAQAAK
jgi:uncharacterized protein YgbK (DUF1537 family)